MEPEEVNVPTPSGGSFFDFGWVDNIGSGISNFLSTGAADDGYAACKQTQATGFSLTADCQRIIAAHEGSGGGTPSPPTNWASTISNAINAISTTFWPKPASSTVVTATMPVVVAPTPWYKTTGGMVAIGVGVLGAAYLYTQKSKKAA